jgi:SAM-dependent methyltransferase
MSVDYPENFARFYDLIYQHLRDSEDHEFFLNEIGNSGGKILEAGVGTGRFFTAAIKMGADIYGIDTSTSMLDVLKDKLNREDHFRISHQSIVDFKLDLEFDLVLAPFRVFQHLLDKSEQLSALNNVYRHLKPGGRFIFDAFVPDLDFIINGIDNVTDFEGEYEPGRKLKRTVSSTPSLINQIIDVSFLLEWDENDSIRSEEWTSPMRFFFRYELEHLVERSDFDGYKILGDYRGNKLREESKDFVVICSKEQG